MRATRILTPQQRLTQKKLYITFWGGAAAYTAAVTASAFTYSLLTWAMVCILLGVGSHASTVIIQGKWREAFKAMLPVLIGIVGGGIIGGLIYAAEHSFPAVSVSGLGIVALTLSTVAVNGKGLTATDLARSCVWWAMFSSLIFTGVSLCTGGLEDSPAYQPMLGALLATWATLMLLACLECELEGGPEI